MTAIAVDANGADLGARGVALGPPCGRRRRSRPALRPGRRAGRRAPRASRSSTPRSRSPRPRTRRAPRAQHPRGLDRPGRQARSPTAAPTRSSSAARPAPALAAGLFHVSRARGIHRPALALPVPGPRRPRSRSWTSAPTSRSVPSTLCSSPSWARRWPRPSSASPCPRVALLTNGEEAMKGTPLIQGGPRRSWPLATD